MTYLLRKTMLGTRYGAVVLVVLTLIALHQAPVALATIKTLQLICNTTACKLTPTNESLFTIENAVPATTQQAIVTVKNTRDDACALQVQLEPTGESSLPLDRLFIAVVSATGEQYLGSVHDGSAGDLVSISDLQTTPQVFGFVQPKETKDFIWYATVDPTLENTHQGSSSTTTISFHTTCDDPARILPTPLPTPTPAPPKKNENKNTNDTTATPTVLGAQTVAQDCATTPTESLKVVWWEKTKVHSTWTGVPGSTSLVFQDTTTEAVFRHRGITANPYIVPHLNPAHTYAFWLETDEVCQNQVISQVAILSPEQPNNRLPNQVATTSATQAFEVLYPDRVLGVATETPASTSGQALASAGPTGSQHRYRILIGFLGASALLGILVRGARKKTS